MTDLPSIEDVKNAILVVRNERVILANDLAGFYNKTVSAFNQAVTRNSALFDEYRFQLTDREVAVLQSQNVISKPSGSGGRRVNPWVYNNYGVVIASTLFKNERSIQITRMMTEAFVESASQTAIPKSALDGDVLPPRDGAPVLQLRAENLRVLAEDILEQGTRSLIDYVRNPQTKRQQAVASIMKTLAETEMETTKTQQQALKLRIAQRLSDRDFDTDDEKRDLLELLNAMKGD